MEDLCQCQISPLVKFRQNQKHTNPNIGAYVNDLYDCFNWFGTSIEV